MATAEITSVTLTMSHDEAIALESLLGGLTGQNYTQIGLDGVEVQRVQAIYRALCDVLERDGD